MDTCWDQPGGECCHGVGQLHGCCAALPISSQGFGGHGQQQQQQQAPPHHALLWQLGISRSSLHGVTPAACDYLNIIGCTVSHRPLTSGCCCWLCCRVFERDGVRVVCDTVSMDFLRGAVVEFEDSLMRSAFQVGGHVGIQRGGCKQMSACLVALLYVGRQADAGTVLVRVVIQTAFHILLLCKQSGSYLPTYCGQFAWRRPCVAAYLHHGKL